MTTTNCHSNAKHPKHEFLMLLLILGCWYGELKNMDYFKAVRAVGDTVEWPDGQDLASHELYENSVPAAKYS